MFEILRSILKRKTKIKTIGFTTAVGIFVGPALSAVAKVVFYICYFKIIFSVKSLERISRLKLIYIINSDLVKLMIQMELSKFSQKQNKIGFIF